MVAAHPDDEILGGGTIAKLASRGEEIAVLFVARVRVLGFVTINWKVRLLSKLKSATLTL